MKYLLVLSKQDLNLAKEEAISLLKPKNIFLCKNLLVIGIPEKRIKLAERLACTKAVYQILFECSGKDLENRIKKYAWNKIYKRDFSLRCSREREGELAGYVWGRLKNPKVSLKNAKTQIRIFEGKKTRCCLLLHGQKQDFESRKPHLRPGFSPVSLHPKLARAMVNLTGIEKGLIIDPFCGTGGLLIEAGLMGLEIRGYDIDYNMLAKSRDNLRHFKIKNFKLVKRNALALGKTSYIATDLPYGKNTKKQDLKRLYSAFFKVLEKNLKKRAVIGIPDFAGYKRLIGKRLRIAGEFSVCLHKSLTKKIIVLE